MSGSEPGPHAAPSASGPLGLIIPMFPQDTDDMPSAAQLGAVCRGAEQAGAGALWACDHLFWPRPHLECMTTLGLAAAATERVVVGSNVVQLALRDPASLAKEAASLWHMSGGRFVLGVGAGGRREEYEAAGVPYGTRGKVLDRAIAALRATWRDGGADTHTDAHPPGDEPDAGQVRPTWCQLPAAPDLPIWIGGSSEAARKRAAARGDGWTPLFLPPDDYARALRRLEEETDRAGRPAASVVPAMTVFCSPTLSRHPPTKNASAPNLAWIASLYGVPEKAFARHVLTGTVEACADQLARYVEAGARHICVFVADDDPLVPFEDLAASFARLDAGPEVVWPGPSGTGGTAVEDRT